MLNKLQLKDIFLSSKAPINSDGSMVFESIKTIRLVGDLLYYNYLLEGEKVKTVLSDMFYSIVKIYLHEFLVIDATVNIIFNEITEKPGAKVAPDQALKAFLSNVITTDNVSLTLFNDVVDSLGFTYVDLVKKIAAEIAMDKFKVDFGVVSPKFFGATESQVIEKCINFIGDYDGPYISVFYQGIKHNFEDNCVTH